MHLFQISIQYNRCFGSLSRENWRASQTWPIRHQMDILSSWSRYFLLLEVKNAVCKCHTACAKVMIISLPISLTFKEVFTRIHRNWAKNTLKMLSSDVAALIVLTFEVLLQHYWWTLLNSWHVKSQYLLTADHWAHSRPLCGLLPGEVSKCQVFESQEFRSL